MSLPEFMSSGFVPWLFAVATFAALLFFILRKPKQDPEEARLQELQSGGAEGQATSAFASMAAADEQRDEQVKTYMQRTQRKKELKDKLAEAGFYSPTAARLFLVGRIGMGLSPIIIGYGLAQMGMMPLAAGLLLGTAIGGIGTIMPAVWLDLRKAERQRQIRKALPDAMDVLVVCLEGGLSLAGSFARVGRELASAHPMLGLEFQIVERQVQMGQTTGEAVREFANRFDLEEVRSMAAVITQAERIGSSVVGALEVYADSLRIKRRQRAEELAQKAVVKMIFPTLFCIFPGIFVVILGPAAIQIYRVLILDGPMS